MPRITIIIRDTEDAVEVEIGSQPDWNFSDPESLSPAQQYAILVAQQLQELITDDTKV